MAYNGICICKHIYVYSYIHITRGFSGGSVVKNLPANAGDESLIPGLGRSPGGQNGNPLQYSFLGNSMDRGAWQATVYRVTKKVRHDLATKTQQKHK